MSEKSSVEKLLEALVNGETIDLVPLSRNETYLLALINGEKDVPAPQSRVEAYLHQLCQNGSGGGGGGGKTYTVTINIRTYESQESYFNGGAPIPQEDSGIYGINVNPMEASVYGAYKDTSTVVIPNVPDGAIVYVVSSNGKGASGMSSARVIEGSASVGTFEWFDEPLNEYGYPYIYPLRVFNIHSDCVIEWNDEY